MMERCIGGAYVLAGIRYLPLILSPRHTAATLFQWRGSELGLGARSARPGFGVSELRGGGLRDRGATNKNGPHLCKPLISIKMVAKDGIEPPTRGFSIPCSTN